MTHDGHHRRAGGQLTRLVGHIRLGGFGAVLLLLHRLEPELAGDELDLVEVEPLVHRHHQAQFLERKLDDLGGGDLHGRCELADRDELVDANTGLFLLALLGRASRHDFAIAGLVTAPALAARRSLHALQCPCDALLHRILVHVAAAALLALLAAGRRGIGALLGIGAEAAGRRRPLARAGTRRAGGEDGTGTATGTTACRLPWHPRRNEGRSLRCTAGGGWRRLGRRRCSCSRRHLCH